MQREGNTIIKHVMLNPQCRNKPSYGQRNQKIISIELMKLRPSHDQPREHKHKRHDGADVPSDLFPSVSH